MTGPRLPEPPEMGDERQRLWAAYDALLDRCGQLEALADRLAATCADPVAISEYLAWKAG